ncbi:MAG: lytic transglycosylase domain-containing protein [Bacteriovoracaceae bacterium]|jgi:soluble lytic murein transglycosylase|nr:lytic transglycosylase domain-containing protein [Bacteriovoracaceae bacterium]
MRDFQIITPLRRYFEVFRCFNSTTRVGERVLALTLVSLFVILGLKCVREYSSVKENLALVSQTLVSHKFETVNWSFGEDQKVFFELLTKHRAQKILSISAPKKLQKNFSKYTEAILEFSEKYQVDPFWVGAIMWTETHFKQRSTSRVGAKGLMQIMEPTGVFLLKQMEKKALLSKQALKTISSFKRPWEIDPYLNIEMGVYYLSSLMKRFPRSASHATVAYNMGPSRIRFRLNKGINVTKRNQYLIKVKKRYLYLVKNFRKNAGSYLLDRKGSPLPKLAYQ